MAQLQRAPFTKICVAATDPTQAPRHPIFLSAATTDTKGLHPSRAGLHAFELTYCMGVNQHGILHLASFILQLWEIVSLCIEFSSVAQSCPALCDPMNCSMPGLPVHHQLQSSLKLMSIESVMPSNRLILCCPLLLLPSIFPNIRVFTHESALRIRWPKYWSFSFNISRLILLTVADLFSYSSV